MLELMDPEVEVRDRPESPDAGVHHRHAGAREVFNASVETFDHMELIPERFVEEGDGVVVVLLMRGTGRGSGVPVEERIAHLWRFTGEKVSFLQVFTEPEDALAQLGRWAS